MNPRLESFPEIQKFRYYKNYIKGVKDEKYATFLKKSLISGKAYGIFPAFLQKKRLLPGIFCLSVAKTENKRDGTLFFTTFIFRSKKRKLH